MFIIVEGPDGAGKSTLVDRLQREAHRRGEGVVLVNPKRSPVKSTLEEYVGGLDWYTPGGGKTLILDRSWLSEDVYGPLWRGHGLDPTERTYLASWALARGATLAILDVDDAELASRLRTRGDEEVPAEEGPVYAIRYRELRRVWMNDGLACNVYAGDSRGIEHDILDRASRTRDELVGWGVDRIPGLVGDVRRCNLLVLGDERSVSVKERGLGCPFPPIPGSCAREVLWPALRGLAARSVRPVVVNASECTPGELKNLWESLATPPVVALGLQAQSRAKLADSIVAGHVPHPQYVRRFQYKLRDQYANAIRRASDGSSCTRLGTETTP